MISNDFKDSLKIQAEQKDIEKKFFNLLDDYQKNNSFENREFLCYLTSAIYLTCRELDPRLSIFIPFRTKSDISFTKNMQKEFDKYIKNSALEEPFDINPIAKDISGFRIVLNDINNSLPSSEHFEQLLNDPEISKLMSVSKDTVNFVDTVDEYLRSPVHNGKKFFELKKEVLKRIIENTPEEFKDERMPNPSFSQLYEESQKGYDYFLQNDNFPTVISALELTELSNLSNDLRSRSSDQLYFAILRKTLPVVFEAPLIKNVLKTSFEYIKSSKKPNGFQADYYALHTPFGQIEVQVQSNKAYYASTKGSSYHSGMNGKGIDIKNFFELVDKNDEHDISYYLDILDNISPDRSLISPYELPEFKTEEEKQEYMKTPRGIAFLESEKYREMMKHIRLKEKIELLPAFPVGGKYDLLQKNDPNKLQELIDCGEIKTITVNINEYLLTTALSLSPYMNVCGSGHTSFTTAGIHHKKVVGEFAEVLRKRDANTCLRDMLIRRLEHIIDNPPENPSYNMKSCLYLVKEHDEIANKLPKDISHRNIINYAEKIRNKQKDNSESEHNIV